MNNDQFRRLVLDQPGKKRADNNNAKADSSPSQTPSAALGSRLRTSIPMTPRHVKGNSNADFARQLAEHRREEMQPPTKRFKSSAAPKGTKFASGYQDRTALRRQQQEDKDEDKNEEKEDVAQRLKALEEMVKLGQIDAGTFEKLRKELGVGGDLGSTHMVKGLDWDLLKRVKAGEDLSKKTEENKEEEEEEEVADVDDELDRVLEQKEDLAPAPPKEKKVKKGNLAPASGKLSRDEILRQLKASRAAAAAAAAAVPESTLGTKFKKIKDDKPEKKRWVETDPASGRRKEILEITDAEGKTKRKVRWLDKKEDVVAPSTVDNNGLLLPSQDAKPLGMEVPAVVAAKIAAEAAAEAEAEDDDIFAGVGTDYNPLADLDEDDSEDDDEQKEEEILADKPIDEGSPTEPSVQPQPQQVRRNYFNDKKAPEEPDTRSNPLTSDPTLLAALKRAAALRQAGRDGDEREEGEADEGIDTDADPETLARRKKFFEERARRDAQDALDLDYGFGSSRIEDEEDEEGPTFDETQRGSNKRKRGPKKRKGDKDSATDVLRVMEGRKNQ